MGQDFYQRVEAALLACEPATKCAAVTELCLANFNAKEYKREAMTGIAVPGRPLQPALTHPRDLPRRGLGTSVGRAALIHAIAHIEFNAINLALDALWRFRGMPTAYYQDWIEVAQDEARHFHLLQTRLASMGYAYGDFPAHNGLWEAACKTASDPLMRMALVPRVLEARGLDVSPDMIRRLSAAGDEETSRIISIILEEEVAHVAVGTRWFRFLCKERDLVADQTFQALLNEHMRPLPKGPLNIPARQRSGFSDAELDYLQRACQPS